MHRLVRFTFALSILCLPAAAEPPQEAQSSSAPEATSMSQRTVSGRVAETMDSSRYTYVLLDTGTEQAWVAAFRFEVKVGDWVTVPGGVPMVNFYSPTLKRTFENILFASHVQVGKPGQAQVSLPEGHPVIEPTASTGAVDLDGIEKAPGGMTVAEVYAQRAELSGQEVAVRGRVVKVLPQILDRNWLHLRDGSGEEGSNDLVITTGDMAHLGDMVLVRGTVAVDQDFGFGYQYDVLLEKSAVTIETETMP